MNEVTILTKLLTSEFSASPNPLLSEPLVICGLIFITFECDCASSIKLLYVDPLVQMNLIIDEARSKLYKIQVCREYAKFE